MTANIKKYSKASKTGWITLLPGLIYLIVFFAIPILILARYSLHMHVIGMGKIVDGISVNNYIEFFKDSFFIKIFWRSLRISSELCIADIILAYPIAYYLAREKSKFVPLISGLSYLPLLASTVVTSFGWMIILSDTGLVNKLLMSIGIISSPLKIMYTEAGVLIALIQATLPFMIISIRNVLFTINPSTEEAAATLGANPYRVFFHVTLPLSFPGIAAGTLLVFVTGMSAFVTPELIGGGQVSTLATVILRETQMNLNWSLAATISIIILFVTFVITTLYNWVLELDILGGGGRR